MWCEWKTLTKGSKCEQCGFELWQDFDKPPKRRCRKPKSVCRHLGPELRIELIQCQTCRGRVRQKFPVHACEVFGECLPTFTGETEIAKCRGCPRYQPSSS